MKNTALKGLIRSGLTNQDQEDFGNLQSKKDRLTYLKTAFCSSQYCLQKALNEGGEDKISSRHGTPKYEISHPKETCPDCNYILYWKVKVKK